MIIHSVMLIACVHLNKTFYQPQHPRKFHIVDVSRLSHNYRVIAYYITFSYIAPLQRKNIRMRLYINHN